MDDTIYDERLPTTLIINRFDSQCGGCNRAADPLAETHERELGWGEQGPGCGVRWEYVTSDYGPDGVADAAAMRPDLESYNRWEN